MTAKRRIPPFDPRVQAAFDADEPGTLETKDLPAIREEVRVDPPELSWFDVERSEYTVPGFDGASIEVTIFKAPGQIEPGPGVYHIHGGGMVGGYKLDGVSLALPWVVKYGATVATVEYRLAPEHPDPIPVEDCYAGLVWFQKNAAELGFNPDQILICGGSAGGGLSAGTALLARDRQGPALIGQMLLCPMLDDRDATISTHQFDGIGNWNRGSNITGWTALLGDRKGTDDVSIYASPARATDLSGLPPTFIDTASAEVFRDENVAYASQIWADGGIAELHVWPGGTHGWEGIMQGSIMARQAGDARDEWVARLFEDL